METKTEPATPVAGGGAFERGVALVGGVMLVVLGAWAFFAPRSFFDTLAVFEPYNEHFIHDIGTFQIGLGAVLVLAIYHRDALFVALAGVGVGLALHALSHIIYRDLGGKPSTDIPFFLIVAILLLVAAFKRRARTT